jgi:hypothetical protein
MAEDCVICSKWPERDRWALRQMITELPLQEEQICDECLRAFIVRLADKAKRSTPTKH